MQNKILIYLTIYLFVGILSSNEIISFQRSKLTNFSNYNRLKDITDTLETIDNFIIFDSLLARTDTLKYFHLYCMGKDYAQVKASLSFKVADSIISHSKRDNYIRGIISGYNLRGIIYNYESDYLRAVTNLKEALKIGERNKNNPSASIKDKYACTLYYLGDLYYKKGDYKTALDYYRRSLTVFNSYNESELLVEDLNYLLTSVAFTTIREDKAYAMYSVGKTYLKMNEVDSAQKYLNTSLILAKNTEYERLEAMIYFSLSETELLINDTITAIDYLTKSVKLSKTNLLNEYLIYNYLNLLRISIARNDYKQIDKIYSNLIELTKQMNMLMEQAIAHQLFSEYLHLIGNSDEAYKELGKSTSIQIRIADENKSREFGQQEASIKYQKQMYDLELKSIQSFEEEKRLTTNLYYTLAVIGLLILIAAIVLLYARKNKRLNQKITKVNEDLEVANTKLIELNDTKTKLFRIISHDLKTPIKEFEMGVLYLIKTSSENESSENTVYLDALSDSANNINRLLNSLLQWAETQFTDITIKKTTVDLQKVISTILSLFNSEIGRKNLQINSNLDILSIYTDQNILQIIIRNIIHNSIKFTPNGGTINIHILKEDDFTIVTIADTGQGMSQEQIKAILNDKHYPINFNDTQVGTGIGLRAVKDYINQIDGNLFIESSPNNGTTVTIYFP